MATVGIGVPTRNRATYVTETIASVQAQTFRDFRVLVSDDASEPATARHVAELVRSLNDPRVSHVYHKQNLQEYDHGRFLFDRGADEFFAILHDDDRWEATFLERCVAILVADPSLACVTTDQYVIDGSGAPRGEMTAAYRRRMGRDRHPEGRLRILEPLLRDSLFGLSSTVFRTAALRRSSLVDPDCHGNAAFDINLFLRLGERDEVGYYLPEQLAAYRIHDDRLSVTEEREGFNPRLLETLMTVLEKRRFSGTAERERRRHLSAVYHNYAILCHVRRDQRGLYRYMWKCIATSPRQWKNWGYLTLAALPFLIKPVFRLRGTSLSPL